MNLPSSVCHIFSSNIRSAWTNPIFFSLLREGFSCILLHGVSLHFHELKLLLGTIQDIRREPQNYYRFQSKKFFVDRRSHVLISCNNGSLLVFLLAADLILHISVSYLPFSLEHKRYFCTLQKSTSLHLRQNKILLSFLSKHPKHHNHRKIRFSEVKYFISG